jgi:hypothetical protein
MTSPSFTSSIRGRRIEPPKTDLAAAGELSAAREASLRAVQSCTLPPAPLPPLLFAAAGGCPADDAGS